MSRLPVGSSANTTAGPVHERAGDGDALLLAAGELGRAVGEPVAEADALDQPVEPLRSGLRPASVSGSRMFSSAVRTGTRLKDWKTKPRRSRRRLVSALSSSAGDLAGRRP